MANNSQNNDFMEFSAIVIILIVIFTIWVSYPHILTALDEPIQPPEVNSPHTLKTIAEQTEETDKTKFEVVGEKYGTYGDSYGSLNTLFSGLAFAVLIISLFMQRQELKAQREELAAQRGELTAQRKEAEQSNKIADEQKKITEQQGTLIKQQIEIAQVQNFYTVFFKQQDILEADFNRLFPKGVAMQNNTLEYNVSSFLEFIDHLNTQEELDLQKAKIDLTRELKRISENINLYFQYSLFLKSLLQIFKFIDDNKGLKGLDINQPINNLLTRLNDETLLSITWLAIAENEKLLNYLEEFSMLRTLPNVINEDQMKFLCHFISEKAFQEPA